MNLFSKRKEERDFDPYVEIVYGQFSFKGDFALIEAVMSEVKENVVPVMEESSKNALKMGLIPMQGNNVAHGEDVDGGVYQ